MKKENSMNEEMHIHISSKHNFFDLKLREVLRYKDLILLLTKRNFVVRYKQTILGPAWLLLNPLLTSVIYAFVFGGIAGIGTEGVPSLLFFMSGNAIWTFFSSCVTANAATFTGNAHVFGKVYFPRLTVSLSNILSSIIQFGIQMVMFFCFLIFYVIQGNVSPNWLAFLILPVILLELGLMGMGVGIIISSMTTKYRDLTILVGFGVQLWMYATPIVYPMSQLGEGWMKTLLLANPVTAPVELFRYAVLGKGVILPACFLWSVLFMFLVVIFGIMVFNKVERTFMDTV